MSFLTPFTIFHQILINLKTYRGWWFGSVSRCVRSGFCRSRASRVSLVAGCLACCQGWCWTAWRWHPISSVARHLTCCQGWPRSAWWWCPRSATGFSVWKHRSYMNIIYKYNINKCATYQQWKRALICSRPMYKLSGQKQNYILTFRNWPDFRWNIHLGVWLRWKRKKHSVWYSGKSSGQN